VTLPLSVDRCSKVPQGEIIRITCRNSASKERMHLEYPCLGPMKTSHKLPEQCSVARDLKWDHGHKTYLKMSDKKCHGTASCASPCFVFG